MRRWIILASISWALLAGAHAWWVPVEATPYDTQMRPIQPFLNTPRSRSSSRMDLDEIAFHMRIIHRIPYHFSEAWLRPEMIRAVGRADCKGKALLLLDELRRAGIGPTLLVIGRRTPSSRQTHAWLEVTVEGRDYILDPTYASRPIARNTIRATHYQRHFGYAGNRKWTAITPGWFVAAQ